VKQADPLVRLLEAGLAAVIILGPLPFGAVVPAGRLAIESFSIALLLLWLVREVVRSRRAGVNPVPTVPRISPVMCVGIGGLLLLTLFQALPLGRSIVSLVSPASSRIRIENTPPPQALQTEREILGSDPSKLDPAESLSVSPADTASALLSGASLAGLLLASFAVSSARGIRTIALAMGISAAFQGMYGVLVLVSGHDMIWHIAKRYYLDCATGTFVNRNHYACFLAATIACAAALAISGARRLKGGGGRRALRWFGPEGTRVLLTGLLVVLALAGLLLSFSRTGIALGVLALCWTLVGSGGRRTGHRILIAALIVGVAAVPLIQIGHERLMSRYTASTEDLTRAGGRAMVWVDTARMAASFPICGTGLGTFSEIYPQFRSPAVRLYYTHAHNDLIQFVAEGGAIGTLFLLCILIPIGRRILAGLGGAWGVIGVGAAAGLTAMLLHALVDFNFHIPSNAALAAILAGSLEGLPWLHRG